LNSPRAPHVYEQFDRRVNNVVKPLISQVWNVELTDHSGTQMIRYGEGGHYLPHADAGEDLPDRYFTALLYLNDDFDGGHTSFPSLDAAVKPKTGQAIIFPARYLHCAEPVTRGEKFVLLTWVCGPVPINWIT
jgi:predicted 2-oxoglutarate/Fe(II)-dependent dioxygenase YbiX